MGELPKNKYIDLIDRSDYSDSLFILNKLQSKKSLSDREKLEIMEAKAECLEGMDKFKEAELLYKNIIDQDEKYFRAYYALDSLYITWSMFSDDKDYDNQRIDLWKKLELIDSSKVSYWMLGGAYDQEKEYEKALDCYKKALKSERQLFWKSDISANIGSVYFRLEDYKNSLKAYQKAVDFSYKEWGNTRSCEGYFAVMREIYRRMDGEYDKDILEMEENYKHAKKLRDKHTKMRKSIPSSQKSDWVKKIEKIEVSEKEIQKERNIKKKAATLIKEEIENAVSFDINNIKDIEEAVDIYVDEYFGKDSDLINIEEKFSYKMDLILLITK